MFNNSMKGLRSTTARRYFGPLGEGPMVRFRWACSRVLVEGSGRGLNPSNAQPWTVLKAILGPGGAGCTSSGKTLINPKMPKP